MLLLPRLYMQLYLLSHCLNKIWNLHKEVNMIRKLIESVPNSNFAYISIDTAHYKKYGSRWGVEMVKISSRAVCIFFPLRFCMIQDVGSVDVKELAKPQQKISQTLSLCYCISRSFINNR